MKILNKFKKWLRRLFNILCKKEMLTLPGQLAFFWLLAIVPTISLIAYGASMFNISTTFISDYITKTFGYNITNLIMPIIEEIKITPSLIVTLFITFYIASGSSSSIIVTSNSLYHFEDTSFIKRKIKSMVMTFILVSMVVFLLLVPTFGNKVVLILGQLNASNNIIRTVDFIFSLTRGPLAWLLVFFLIKIIYTMAPDGFVPSKYNNKGTLFTTFGINIVTLVYSYYVNNIAHYDILYGSLSHIVILMMWLYLIAYIIVIGIAINTEEYENIKKD